MKPRVRICRSRERLSEIVGDAFDPAFETLETQDETRQSRLADPAETA